jgi:hypothetical protein
MDFDIVIKIATLLGGAVATWRVVVELLRGRHGHLREEYKFARDFLKEVNENPKMHPFLKQKGYQAIAGDTRLSAGEIEYLLTLHDSARSLKDYVLGKPYLEHLATAAGSQIVFQRKFESRWPRLLRKALFFVLYLMCYFAGFAPITFPLFKTMPPAQALITFAFTAALFFPAGFLALRAGVRVARAETLVKNQPKHVQGILVA